MKGGRKRLLLMLLGSGFSAVVTVMLGYMCTPSRTRVVVRNDSSGLVTSIAIGLGSEVRRHAELQPGEQWYVEFNAFGDGDYAVAVQRDSGALERVRLGYVTHGVAAWDTLVVKDTTVEITSGPVVGWH